VCELATALLLLVVTSCVYKCVINQITNPNPVYGHTQSSDNNKKSEQKQEGKLEEGDETEKK
jgi:hypothetical protein